VKWKGCIVVERGACVDVADHDEWSTEIVIRGKHWLVPDVVAGRACPTTSTTTKTTP
jgi:hypothetical protein